jgi:hypothetical protein
VNLKNAKIAGIIDMDGATFDGVLVADSLQVGGHLLMASTDQNKASFKQVILRGAKVAGQVAMDGATFDGDLDADSLQVGGHLLMRSTDQSRATFKNVNLNNAKVIGNVEMDGASFVGDLEAYSLQVRNLFMRLVQQNSASFNSANVTGDVETSGAEVSGPLNFSGTKIAGDLSLIGGHFLTNLILNGTRIEGSLILNGQETIRSAELADFTFSIANWGADPLSVLTKVADATSDYYPRLYERLAKTYADQGQQEVARKILIRKQDAAFRHSNSILEKAYLFVMWLTTNYGYRPQIGLVWIAGFAVVSAIIFKIGANHVVDKETQPNNWLIFALDAVIPGINLDKRFDDVKFSDWRQKYLYLLRFLGVIVVVLILEFLKQSIIGPR